MGNIPFWGDGPEGFDASNMIDGLYATNPWDIVYIDGMPLPGICNATAQPKIKIDKKNPPGAAGSTSTIYGGVACEQIVLSVTIWTPRMWDEFQAWMKILFPPVKKAKSDSHTISHPNLDLFGIKAVIFVAPASPMGHGGGGNAQIKTFTFRCQEYLPPGKSNKTKNANAPTGNTPTVSDQRNATNPPVSSPQLLYTPANAEQPPPSQDANYCGPNGS